MSPNCTGAIYFRDIDWAMKQKALQTRLRAKIANQPLIVAGRTGDSKKKERMSAKMAVKPKDKMPTAIESHFFTAAPVTRIYSALQIPPAIHSISPGCMLSSLFKVSIPIPAIASRAPIR
ncbi:hypothetical protein D1872_307080 [compost metagenome]